MSSRAITGTVLAVQANFYRVRLTPQEGLPPSPPELLCTRRSRLKKIGQQVMVGDRVWIEEPDWAGERGAIAAVLPRQSELDRPPIANVDQILLMFAVEDPALDPVQLSRFLVKAESIGVGVQLLLSKCDLVNEAVLRYWQQRLNRWGYNPLLVSLHPPRGLAELQDHLQHHITVVSGPSGVGKSSLINALLPHLTLRVGAVSGKLARGRHTTRHVELFELTGGGFLADSPGFNQPELRCEPEDLPRYFPEIRQRLASHSCQFSNCRHRDEPNCAVRGDWERYEIYRQFLTDVEVYAQENSREPAARAGLKRKMGDRGQVRYEPVLAPEKYRRESRKASRQALRDYSRDWRETVGSEDDLE